MSNYIKKKELKSWQEFVSLWEGYSINKKIGFRGQANFNKSNRKFEEWEITSSYNRLGKYWYHIEEMMRQDFDYWGDYFDKSTSFPKATFFQSANWLEKIIFFQHYGIETPLVDFTKDPLIALYFAVSDINFPYVQPDHMFNGYFLNIYEVNFDKLNKHLGLPIIDSSNIPVYSYNYDNYSIKDYVYDSSLRFDFHCALIPNPPLNKWNKNLSRQKGCFILYDMPTIDGVSTNISFEKVVEDYCILKKIPSNENFIKIYSIPYAGIFREMDNGKTIQNPIQKTIYSFFVTNQFVIFA